jgi:hypothetical protein
MADVLSAPPRKARSPGRGRLPSVDNLIDADAAALIATLRRFGIEPDLEAIERRASAAFQRLDALLAEGQEPDEATWESLEKQIESDITRGLREMVKAAIRNYQDARGEGQAQYAIWQTVGDEKVCPSCEPRHGRRKTWSQWDRSGRPGSAALICSTECRCRLLPDVVD